MSVGDARNGRRDNGLVAAAYTAAGDVDPRVGEHLLDVLALEGIAAYLRPSSDLHPVTRSTTLPKRPTDRLYVDTEHLSTARQHLARLAHEEREAEAPIPADQGLDAGEGARASGTDQDFSEPTSDEVDRVFAQIVAGYARTAGPPGETEPPQAPPPPSLDDAAMPRRTRRRQPEPEQEPSLLDGLDTFGAELPDDEGAFVPPEPPPIPRPSLPTALGVIGVIGGLAVFIKPDLLPFFAESLAMFLGFTAVVTGFGTLVWRLRPGGDDEDDTDDGARV